MSTSNATFQMNTLNSLLTWADLPLPFELEAMQLLPTDCTLEVFK